MYKITRGGGALTVKYTPLETVKHLKGDSLSHKLLHGQVFIMSVVEVKLTRAVFFFLFNAVL